MLVLSLLWKRMCERSMFFFFFNDTATTEIYTLSLHDALPISIFQVGERDPLVAHPRSDDCGLDQGNGWSVAIVPQRPAPLLVEVELQAPDACQSGDPAPRRADQAA